MTQIRISAGDRSPAEIEDYLEKAVRAVSMSQDADFSDPVMQEGYEEARGLFEQIIEAMAEDIEALS